MRKFLLQVRTQLDSSDEAGKTHSWLFQFLAWKTECIFFQYFQRLVGFETQMIYILLLKRKRGAMLQWSGPGGDWGASALLHTPVHSDLPGNAVPIQEGYWQFAFALLWNITKPCVLAQINWIKIKIAKIAVINIVLLCSYDLSWVRERGKWWQRAQCFLSSGVGRRRENTPDSLPP